MSNFYTLAIDGNYFARRAFSVLTNDKDGCSFSISTYERDRKKYLTQLAKVFSSTIRTSEKYIDRVIIARDYSSWRKQVEIIRPLESQKELDQYKENRKDDEAINWKGVYETTDEFFEALEKYYNVPTIKTKGAEGDDILYVCSRVLNKQNIRVMLWSSDGDMSQLVNKGTVYYKLPKKVLYVHEKFATDFVKQEQTIFNMDFTDLNKSVLESVAQQVATARPFNIVLNMITSGDKKDNAPALFNWKTGSRNARPTAKHIKKVLATMGYEDYPDDFNLLYDDQFVDTYLSELMKVCKQPRDLAYTKSIFETNRKLLYLSHTEIPEDILRNIINILKQKTSRTDISSLTSFQNIINSLKITEAGSLFDSLLSD